MQNAATPTLSTHPPSNRTFRVSLWIIGLIAAAQIGAIAFAVIRNDLGNRDLADRRPNPPQFTLKNSTTVPAGFPAIGKIFATADWEPTEAPIAFEPTTNLAPIQDPLVRDKVEFARLAREDGDVQTALEQFRSANEMLPGNPEILYELANCYNLLDLPDDASDCWLEIRNLGLERAGEFYAIAELALLGSRDGAPSPQKMVTLSNHRLFKNPQETTGEMLTLRTSIKARAGVEIDPGAVQLRILFFDLVNGHTIARGLNDGNYPQRMVTEPLDWKDTPNEEIIDFAYYRPYAQDEASGEQRQFYGFVAQLFYDNEWQDLVASPRTLIEEMRAADDFDLSPPSGNRSRVENSLFPQP